MERGLILIFVTDTSNVLILYISLSVGDLFHDGILHDVWADVITLLCNKNSTIGINYLCKLPLLGHFIKNLGKFCWLMWVMSLK